MVWDGTIEAIQLQPTATHFMTGTLSNGAGREARLRMGFALANFSRFREGGDLGGVGGAG